MASFHRSGLVMASLDVLGIHESSLTPLWVTAAMELFSSLSNTCGVHVDSEFPVVDRAGSNSGNGGGMVLLILADHCGPGGLVCWVLAIWRLVSCSIGVMPV